VGLSHQIQKQDGVDGPKVKNKMASMDQNQKQDGGDGLRVKNKMATIQDGGRCV